MRKCIDVLKSCGAHINMRADNHEKVAVIDGDILWEGSLNIFSHNRTSENMRRFVSADKVDEAIAKFGLGSCSTCASNNNKYQLNILADLVVRCRKSHGLSQQELAKRSGISQARLSQIESGKANITAKTFAKLVNSVDGNLLLVKDLHLACVTNLLNRIDSST